MFAVKLSFAVAVSCVCSLVSVCMAEEKLNVIELKREIKEAEAKLSDLRGKLAIAQGEPTEFRDGGFSPGFMKIGDSGEISRTENRGAFVVRIDFSKIVKIIDEDTILLRIDRDAPDEPYVIVKGFPTKDYADGQLVEVRDRPWKVVGREKYKGELMFVIREATKEKPKVVKPRVIDKKK